MPSRAELAEVDGVMLGRVAYHHPYLLAEADAYCFGAGAPQRSREEVVEALLPYAEAQLARGVGLRAIARHVLGLYHGAPGARAWRRVLSDSVLLKNAGPGCCSPRCARSSRMRLPRCKLAAGENRMTTSNPSMRKTIAMLIGAAMLPMATPASAQAPAYPDKPIRIVVPFAGRRHRRHCSGARSAKSSRRLGASRW